MFHDRRQRRQLRRRQIFRNDLLKTGRRPLVGTADDMGRVGRKVETGLPEEPSGILDIDQARLCLRRCLLIVTLHNIVSQPHQPPCAYCLLLLDSIVTNKKTVQKEVTPVLTT